MVHSTIITLCICFFLFSYFSETCTSLQSLAVNQSIRDYENETLVSAGGVTEVGFFSPGNSITRRYLGIWFRNVTPLTVVWVANRNTPLHNNSGVLKLNEKGILVLLDATNSTIWSSSNIATKAEDNPIAYPLDSGNFVVKNEHQTNKDSFLWQSFDYPTDTLIPGMKLGGNLETGEERFLLSWKAIDDPAVGEYSTKVDLRGYPQYVILKGSEINVRAGPWNGEFWGGYSLQSPNTSQTFVFNEKEAYYEIKLLDSSVFTMYRLTPSGAFQNFFWTNETVTRPSITSGEVDQCENYAYCGTNSVCYNQDNNATCECLRGYVPMSPDHWSLSIWSGGCVPRNKSNCENNYTDGFLKYTNLKLPDTSSSWFSKSMNLDECHKSCLQNCSCSAYASLDSRNGGSGCLLWFNTLVDMRRFSQSGGEFSIRVPASELDHVGHGNNRKKIVGISVGVTTFGLIVICVCTLIIRKQRVTRKFSNKHNKNKNRIQDTELPTFDLLVLANATEHFSTLNKLGEGGFGSVYKGTLIDGQEIAVKRLSNESEQGIEEFKNEVALIAKLQHRNLVKLLGCCIEGEEKMLVYEYMPNKSLNYFVFDETKGRLLDWCKRFNIICGIARGLLYLHQDSRLRIIHRDLKTSNILLDANLDPRISDFGLAQSFLGDQFEAKTNRVVGTYGYMPPEYAVRGNFSVKLDVFSYGVIILEIVSGKKNREFLDPEYYHNLLGHAWRLWTEERALELLDKVLEKRCTTFEVLRCIQIGLLCVQQKPQDRPDMLSVVLMLNGEKLLPKPMVPAFYGEKNVTSEGYCQLGLSNELSFTELDPR